MEATNELGPMLDAEDKYIQDIKIQLARISETLTEKAVHDLRMGFRTKALIDLKLSRAREAQS